MNVKQLLQLNEADQATARKKLAELLTKHLVIEVQSQVEDGFEPDEEGDIEVPEHVYALAWEDVMDETTNHILEFADVEMKKAYEDSNLTPAEELDLCESLKDEVMKQVRDLVAKW
jgi:hypothetical protein